MTTQYLYNSGHRPGGRYPRLWIVYMNTVYSFEERDIFGIVKILSRNSRQVGRHKSNEFALDLTPGAVPCELLSSMHGQLWPDSTRQAAYDRFRAIHRVELSFGAFDSALARDYPMTRSIMLATEEGLKAPAESAP